MSFVPNTGDFFYCSVIPRVFDKVVEDPMSGTVSIVKVKHEDGSFRGDIFKCLARDNTIVVAKKVTDSFRMNTDYRFTIKGYNFEPIGPEVRKYYKLDEVGEQNEQD